MGLSIFSISLVLFLIMDPLGNISSFLTVLEGKGLWDQRKIIFREMCIALVAMLFFNFVGEYIFQLLDLSEISVRLAGGLILFLFALKILFPGIGNPRENLPQEEPFIIPLAIPLIASPSLLATIMLYAHSEAQIATMLVSILIAWVIALLVMLNANGFFQVLGKNGLLAIERLMGMILIMLGIQRFMDGVHQFYQTYG